MAMENLKFERADWTSFRTVEGLQQKAGVPADQLRRLVLKEIADNSLDCAAENVDVDELPNGGYVIEDDGPGIDGTPKDIARLFSINRPMLSTKLWRMPNKRGALGNGLRVVAGAVIASDGSLVVSTHDQRITLRPEWDGNTTVVKVEPVDFPRGTRVEISFGEKMPPDEDALEWAKQAVKLGSEGTFYGGKTSPYWYDVDHFHELLSACDASVREVVAELDGCTGAKAGEIVDAAGLSRVFCKEVTQAQAKKLLQTARLYAKPVTPQRLGAIGPDAFPTSEYARSFGELHDAEKQIPFVVEAWAKYSDIFEDTDLFGVYVNRTPVTGDINAFREGRKINFQGCGLHHDILDAPKSKQFAIHLSIITPYVGITSDGKEPNLRPFFNEICTAVSRAVRKAYKP
jgi:hypothetical protein